jgi:hypothetical protein
LGLIADWPLARSLTSLEYPIPDVSLAHTLASAHSLAGLTALGVTLKRDVLEHDPERSAQAESERLELLARSPHLAGIRHLAVRAHLSPSGTRALVQHPSWSGLRKLALIARLSCESISILAGSTLSELDDLQLSFACLTSAEVRALAQIPLLRQLRYLSVNLDQKSVTDNDILALADALDPERLEAFKFRGRELELSATCEAELRARFGERVARNRSYGELGLGEYRVDEG